MLQKSCSLVLPAPFKVVFWLKHKANIHTVSTSFQLHRVPSTVVKHQPQLNTQIWGSNAWGWDTALWWSYPKQGLLLKGWDLSPLSTYHPSIALAAGLIPQGPEATPSFPGVNSSQRDYKGIRWAVPQERQQHTMVTKDRTVPSRGNAILSWLRWTTELWLLAKYILKSSYWTKKLLHVMEHSFATDGPTEDRRHVSAILRAFKV